MITLKKTDELKIRFEKLIKCSRDDLKVEINSKGHAIIVCLVESQMISRLRNDDEKRKESKLHYIFFALLQPTKNDLLTHLVW